MRLIEKVWFKNHRAKYYLVPLLLPLTLVFWLISTLRRLGFLFGILKSYAISKPVIVVGNIGVGGNGKTPVVVHLVELAKKQGLKPGVISRGYGGTAENYPYLLDESSTTKQAGDEPVLIYQRCKVPVVVGRDRVANAKMLVAQGCDIIISDDGLQHYRLQRDVDIIVIDSKRQFGNGFLLPAGPLREGTWRLKHADLLIYNGIKTSEQNKTNNKVSIKESIKESIKASNEDESLLMLLAATEVVHIQSAKKISLNDFLKQKSAVNAIAGIGDPQRFFDTLQTLGFNLLEQKGFIDHKDFILDDFEQFNNELPLLMTEKDAVKCHGFAQDNWWYLPVNAQFSAIDEQKLAQCIDRCRLNFISTKQPNKEN